MRHLRTGLAGTFSLLALVLVGCGQVATNTLSGDDADAAAVPPTITSQPASQSVPAGKTAKFSVAATGSAPIAYQWRKNGSMIEGAVSDTYSAPATAEDDGAAFSVIVSNAVGSVESAAAKLFVMPADVAPSITVQPADQSVTTGQTATFSVTATGSEPLSYQWQRNSAPISGATDSSYTTAAASSADDGALFTVIVSNPVGSISSHPARLGVSTASGGVVAPTISGQPADVSIRAGQIATFTVTASGTAPLVYQWTRNGHNIPGANAASYSTPPVAASDSGALFGVIIANDAGYVTSRGAKLTVSGTAPKITTQPADQTVAAGKNATFAVVATGTAPLTYQWRKNGAAIGGATSASFTTGGLTSADSGATYSVVVSNAAGTATSRGAKLTVSGTAPSITTQPQDQTIAAGKTATFTVVATGSAPLSYQWRRNGTTIPGATSASYTTPSQGTSDNGATFSVVISNGSGNVTSRAARLTVTAAASAPAITTQPADQSIHAGQTATFTVVATGSAPLSYQWRRNGTAIPGATSASYTTPSQGTSDNGATFSVVISNGTGNVTSRAARLTVTAAASAPAITTQPADQSIHAGQTATFTVVATGSAPLSYQWRRNGTTIPGATSASYTTPSQGTSDNGATFSVVISNGTGNVTSRAARLTVTAAASAPAITTQPADQSIHAGQTATFTVVATGSAPLSYQWRRNGTAIPGATSASYTTPSQGTSDNGATFSVVISNSTGNVTSRNALLTVTPAVSTAGTDVVTYKNDLARTGQNLNEKTLTPANVKHARFGKLQFLSTDGKVDAQPLYLSALSIGGVKHNVVFVATENDSAYAFDADTGTQLWKASLVPAGETVAGELPQVCDVIEPTIGVTATPVIDRGAGAHGTIYLVAMTKSSTTWHQRLHALDVTTGAEVAGGPREITATYDTAGGTITFDPGQYLERAGLLLLHHTVYTTWTSHCDNKFYTGWIIAYDQGTLQRTAVLNIAPNSGGVGPSIWMSGGAPAVDAAGNIYVITANGAFESALDAAGFPNLGDYGNSFLKLSTSGGGLRVTDYFAPNNTAFLSAVDFDLGAGGVMLLPDMTDSSGTVRHLAVGAGKDGNMYVVNRDSMGHFSPSSNNIWQQLNSVLGGGIWSTPAYFNGHIYYGQTNGALKSFSISAAKVVLPADSSSSVTFGFPGTAPSVSANGTANGIIWAHQNANPAVLYAFDANDVSKPLYSSSQAANGRDQFGAGNKFITPVIADGKVFVGAASGVAVFGLLK